MNLRDVTALAIPSAAQAPVDVDRRSKSEAPGLAGKIHDEIAR